MASPHYSFTSKLTGFGIVHVDCFCNCTVKLLVELRWMMDDLRFYVLLNSISVISGQCLDDNERLCAMEHHLWLRRFL